MNHVLLSSAYFPPSVYFCLTESAEVVTIEKWENYHKQTYRNRCIILGANGSLTLTIPVERGSFHKTPVRDVKIDNSLRWRQVHIRSIISAYALAPYFEYYIDTIEEIINYNETFLLDFNLNAMEKISGCLGIKASVVFSDHFTAAGDSENDFRYIISPKIKNPLPGYSEKPYMQVFSDKFGFTPGLSIIDMLLNNGPGTRTILHESLVI